MSSSATLATSIECASCRSGYSLSEKELVCPNCEGILDIKYDANKLGSLSKASLSQRPKSLWRYREFLPIARKDCIISIGEGMTPLIHPKKYGDSVGLKKLHLKLDFLNPTGSFKDRGSTVSVSRLKELSISAAFDDSSGNAGSSLAAYCAAASIRCTLYVPADASGEKILQAEMYGARILRVRGSRAAATRRAMIAWKKRNAYYASHVLSPFFLEGTKTIAYEICEDLGWRAPDHMVFPVGGGTFLLGAWKGFSELRQVGWIDRIPKLHCIQSRECMPIVRAFKSGGTRIERVPERKTVASGIRIRNPVRGEQVLQAIRSTGGDADSVSDAEILSQQKFIARTEGIFAEPTSCAALAGLLHLYERGKMASDEVVVVPLTGFGLKDVEAARIPAVS